MADDETPEPVETGPEPTHWLELADGRTVDSHGAIPTSVHDENGVTPVVRAWER